MMSRRGFASAATCTLLFAFSAGCTPFGEDRGELRYRLSVEVETPQGVRRGSSVIEVVAVRNPNWVNPEGRGTRGKYRGEAVAIDLPNGRTLFALLRSEGGSVDAPSYWPVLAYNDILDPNADFVQHVRQLAQIPPVSVVKPLAKTEHVLPNGGSEISALPLLVTFGDLNDPESVRAVDYNDLAASFGAGYKLKSITAEITNARITNGIAKRLSWLPQYYDKMLDGDALNRSKELPNNLSQNSFQQGSKQ